MSEETPPETKEADANAEDASPEASSEPVGTELPAADPDAHIEKSHLFALLYVQRGELPNGEGEDDDKELVRLRQDIDSAERYQQPLAEEHRLGPETIKRYWAHAFDCTTCRCLLLEDGPDARPPRTEAEVVSQAAAEEERRKKLKIKFFIDTILGTAFFIGATVTINIMRAPKETEEGAQMVSGKMELDPMAILFMVLILAASWFFAEAYGIAKELWVDFSAWKKAVPVVGKAWHAKGVAKKLDQTKRIGGGGAKPGSDS
jgi:hypothetical protein